MYILIKKFIHSKRKSKNIAWKGLFMIRDRNFRGLIEGINSRFNKHKWLHHTNITNKYRDILYRGFEPVLETKKMKCNPRASVEIHAVSGHFHLTMYILAIKSFLRFYDDVAIVVHDGDNTFTEKDVKILKEHIKGIKIIKKNFADKQMEKILRNFPKTQQYRSRIVNSFELLDNLEFAKTTKIISINSDILFFKKPTQLINWIKQKKPPITYVYENVPAMQREFLQEMQCSFSPHFTLALACVYKDILNYPIIEDAIRRSKITKTHPWLLGQCIYPLLLDRASDKYDMKIFEKERFEASGVFKKNPIFRHYWSSLGIFLDLHISDAKKVMKQLG